MGVSFGIQAWIEGGVITFVILLNVTIGFSQEYSAQKIMASLRDLSSPTANVVRDGELKVLPSYDVVPGDLVEVKMGDTIPADIRLIETLNFETDEKNLTGEAMPVRKDEDQMFDGATGPGDRINVAYSSTGVTKGRARGVVFATGAYTEMGLVAMGLDKDSDRRRHPVRKNSKGRSLPHHYAQAFTLASAYRFMRLLGVNKGTPLQRRLSLLAVSLFAVAVVCALIALAANKFVNDKEVIIYAVATGLSMIPASLVAVLTITMTEGTRRMVKKNVIVRKLTALEALGSVTDICSDKTGTLTVGQMVARSAWLPGVGTYNVLPGQSPFDPTDGEMRFDPRQPRELRMKEDPENCGAIAPPSDLLSQSQSGLVHFLRVASLANLAYVRHTAGEWHVRGDPTEIAIQVLAARFGWNRLDIGDDWTELAELPFDSDVKRMSVIMRERKSGQMLAMTKGAVERVLDRCETYCPADSEETAPVTPEFIEEALENMRALAGLGLRVLALASKPYENAGLKKGDEVDRDSVESGLIFRGLVGLYDPPRPESRDAVRACHEAGICVHMLTGDHADTARAIATEIGILPPRMNALAPELHKSICMTAAEFDALSDDEIDQLPILPLVIARCAPTTKVRMIDALHRMNRFTAMTGDGVNDAPALTKADVGIAMGQTGSQVTRDASDLVLQDDNFQSIVHAIAEGRRIFDNIQKFVLHVLATNVAQACTLLIGLVFKDTNGLSVFPLAPVEIIWIIMATSALPDMGLGFERPAPDIMRRRPLDRKGFFTWEFITDMLVYGLWTAALCLAAFVLVVYGWGDGDLGENCNNAISESCELVFRARATTFACLTWFALFLAWELIDTRRSFFRMHPETGHVFTQWVRDVWANKFLFFSVLFGFVTLFPLLYIPVLSTTVFKHTGISWEWGIVFVAATLFFVGVEAWKWAKRVYFRRKRPEKYAVTDIELGESREKDAWAGLPVIRSWGSQVSGRKSVLSNSGNEKAGE
jgi:Na+-exporting ATPase